MSLSEFITLQSFLALKNCCHIGPIPQGRGLRKNFKRKFVVELCYLYIGPFSLPSLPKIIITTTGQGAGDEDLEADYPASAWSPEQLRSSQAHPWPL